MEYRHWCLVYEDENLIFIVDLDDGGKSITNDVEYVVEEIRTVSKRLFYRDSTGAIDEIVHDGEGNFIKFLAGDPEIQEKLSKIYKEKLK